MGPALSPGAVAQEMAACAVLGGVLGAARAVLPTRGRAAFLPDMLFVGAALMALQSYAVSQSQAGQLRGYMALAAFCAAGAVQAALRPEATAASERAIPSSYRKMVGRMPRLMAVGKAATGVCPRIRMGVERPA